MDETMKEVMEEVRKKPDTDLDDLRDLVSKQKLLIQSKDETITANKAEIEDLKKQNREKDAKIKYLEMPFLQKTKLKLAAFCGKEQPAVSGNSEQGKQLNFINSLTYI